MYRELGEIIWLIDRQTDRQTDRGREREREREMSFLSNV